MNNSNTIIMLESRNQELQTEVNKLSAEKMRLEKILAERTTTKYGCLPCFKRLWARLF